MHPPISWVCPGAGPATWPQSLGLVTTITLFHPALNWEHGTERGILSSTLMGGSTPVWTWGDEQISFQSPSFVATALKPEAGGLPEPSIATKSQNSLSERLRRLTSREEPFAPRAFWIWITSCGGFGDRGLGQGPPSFLLM